MGFWRWLVRSIKSSIKDLLNSSALYMIGGVFILTFSIPFMVITFCNILLFLLNIGVSILGFLTMMYGMYLCDELGR